VCLKRSVNRTRKQTKQKIQTNLLIGLQNNRHPSQHTVRNVHKASGNCHQRPLFSYEFFMLVGMLYSVGVKMAVSVWQ
jgi:hypothetical protein